MRCARSKSDINFNWAFTHTHRKLFGMITDCPREQYYVYTLSPLVLQLNKTHFLAMKTCWFSLNFGHVYVVATPTESEREREREKCQKQKHRHKLDARFSGRKFHHYTTHFMLLLLKNINTKMLLSSVLKAFHLLLLLLLQHAA